MSTTAETGQEFITHFGVKGMHWGVRRAEARATREAGRRAKRPAAKVQVEDSIGKSRFANTKIKGRGGENHPAHPDALKVASAQQKLKMSGSHALSNDELRDVANRLNLEQQVHALNSKRPKSIGEAFVNQQLTGLQKDPVGTARKVSKFGKNVKRAATVAAVVG